MTKPNLKKQEKIKKNEKLLLTKYKKEYDSLCLPLNILKRLSIEDQTIYTHKKFKDIYKEDVPTNFCESCLESSIYGGYVSDEEISKIMNKN